MKKVFHHEKGASHTPLRAPPADSHCPECYDAATVYEDGSVSCRDCGRFEPEPADEQLYAMRLRFRQAWELKSSAPGVIIDRLEADTVDRSQREWMQITVTGTGKPQVLDEHLSRSAPAWVESVPDGAPDVYRRDRDGNFIVRVLDARDLIIRVVEQIIEHHGFKVVSKH